MEEVREVMEGGDGEVPRYPLLRLLLSAVEPQRREGLPLAVLGLPPPVPLALLHTQLDVLRHPGAAGGQAEECPCGGIYIRVYVYRVSSVQM